MSRLEIVQDWIGGIKPVLKLINFFLFQGTVCIVGYTFYEDRKR